MSQKPICRSMNFSIYGGMLDRYKDSADIMESCTSRGLNGLEVIRAGESDQGKILPEMVNGVHLPFHIFWMDWWKGRYDRLDKEFDSREQWIEYFKGMDPQVYVDDLRADLQYAEEVGAKYVVFHVAEVTLPESFTYTFRYTDEEVIDASLEIINQLLSEHEYPFDFLVENLWWSGFTLKDVQLTKRLIDGIKCERKGIMFDTGHFLNTSSELYTPEAGVAYIHKMLDAHEEAGLLKWFKGMHLQMSLGGGYVKWQKKMFKKYPVDFENIPFYDLFALAYDHACHIDIHHPFVGKGVREMVERINPSYVTFEYQQNSRKEYEGFVEAQSKTLGYL